MTQEDKELLLKDLCARLPYGIKITNGIYTITLKVRIDTAPATLAQFINSEGLKYYLRPMSSMTKEEWLEFDQLLEEKGSEEFGFDVDWLNARHFDYRGLIPMGLAIEVTKDDNPYKNDI